MKPLLNTNMISLEEFQGKVEMEALTIRLILIISKIGSLL